MGIKICNDKRSQLNTKEGSKGENEGQNSYMTEKTSKMARFSLLLSVITLCVIRLNSPIRVRSK
jgi:hypothetical protein